MPEIKNTFVGSKMNKDLDSRLIPNGEYREGKNISVSTSEGSDVGALENIKGNIKVTDFNLTGDNLEIIGYYADVLNSRIYFFITNFSDSSIDSLRNYSSPSKTITLNGITSTINGADHYICYCQIPSFENTFDVENIVFKTLLTGTFLNFSKTHPILGVNLLENLLFWTDNRNQPRKINVEKAINNSSYYNSEDNISVAKYAPFSPISFLKNVSGTDESTLINEKDEWLAPFFGLPGQIYDRNAGAPIDDVLLFGNSAGRLTDHLPTGAASYDIRITSAREPNKGEAIVKSIVADSSGDFIYIKSISGADINDITTTLGWLDGTFLFQLRNPNYNSSFAGDKNLLENKFVRFSYRFKYDENDYSLTAPFSQHAFVPKQYGYFVGIDSDEAKQSSIVEFMENQITTAGLVINLPYKSNELADKLKVDEIQLLYKASDDLNVKVIADVKVSDFTGLPSTMTLKSSGSGFAPAPGTITNKATTGGSGSGLTLDLVVNAAGETTSATVNISGEGYKVGDVIEVPIQGGGTAAEYTVASLSSTYIYKYSSEKPIKVLTDEEVTRVSDIVPMRAQTQEVVGNRIIYGNFLQNKTTPDSLRYSVSKVNKGTNSPSVKKELINHNLKQNRSYQVGIVLQDRYGRASNVILSNNELTFNSSFFSNYSNGGTDPLTWGGDSLKVEFDELIPSEKTTDYVGVWNSDTNPLGWYTYKLVVKQQEQDYYNIYTAGSVSGNFDFEKWETPITYSNTESVSQIALFNDNINKVPRNLKEVGPSDKIYSSSTVLYNRVKQTHRGSDNSPDIANIGEQNRNPSKIEITNIKPFREIGDWTTKKNIDMHYFLEGAGGGSQLPNPGVYIYPGFEGSVNPFFMKDNKNPLVATLKTNNRLGYTSNAQQAAQQNNNDIFAKQLNVFETNPIKSAIDIYYETSTSGLISDFNNNVEAGFGTPAPGGLTDINIQFRESTTSPVDVSNTFQIAKRSTQNQPLNNSTCRITTPEVFTINSNGQRSQVLPSPVTLQEVQAAALPSTPPIYKLTSANTEIFNSLSTLINNYIIKFTLKVDGFADVVVEKEFNLTNVKPSIYKIMSSEITLNDGGFRSIDPSAGDFWFDGNFIDNGGLQAFLDSDENNPVNVVNYAGNDYNNAYILNQNYIVKSQNEIQRGVNGPIPQPDSLNIAGGEAFEYSVSRTLPDGGNQVRLSSLYYSPLDICYFGFTTNGAELISSFSENNDAKFVNTGNVLDTKDEGVTAKILSVTRYNARFKGNVYPSKIYCTDLNSGIDKINDFTIRDIASGPTTNLSTDRTGGVYPTISYVGGAFQNSDFEVGSNPFTGWRGAYMYYIKLGITDASDGAGSLASIPYYIKLVIYNNFS